VHTAPSLMDWRPSTDRGGPPDAQHAARRAATLRQAYLKRRTDGWMDSQTNRQKPTDKIDQTPNRHRARQGTWARASTDRQTDRARHRAWGPCLFGGLGRRGHALHHLAIACHCRRIVLTLQEASQPPALAHRLDGRHHARHHRHAHFVGATPAASCIRPAPPVARVTSACPSHVRPAPAR
jgi:hypothetical protein